MTEERFISGWFPVPGDTVSCGLRQDLPKSLRRHEWMSLGPDWKNKGEQGLVQADVRACLLCGKDSR